MAQLKGLSTLNSAIEKLKELAEEIRNNLDEKQSWFDEKSDTWQESDKGVEWQEHLDAVSTLLDDIDSLEVVEG